MLQITEKQMAVLRKRLGDNDIQQCADYDEKIQLLYF